MNVGQQGEQVRGSDVVGRISAQGTGEVGHRVVILAVVHALACHLLVGAAVGLAQVFATQLGLGAVALGFEIHRGAGDAASDDGESDGHSSGDSHAVTAHEASDQVATARRAGGDRLVAQVARDVVREIVRAAVAAVRVTFECLESDPVEVSLDGRLDGGGLGRIFLRQIAQQDVDRLLRDVRRCDERLAADQFKKDAAQRIHVGACVHMRAAVLDLLRADVARRADELIDPRGDGVAGAFAFQNLRDAEVDDLGHGFASLVHHHDVAGLDVAVDDPFLVRVIHRTADRNEQRETLAQVQVVLLAVADDGAALHHLHHEIGSADVRLARVQDAGDVGMLHDGERALFDGEAAQNVRRSHARLHNLDRHDAVDRLHLLCTIDHTEATLAEFVEQSVAVADPAVIAGEGLHVGARL